jgi:hypothetical protein
MPFDETLARRLLASADTDVIWRNRLFRERVLNQPGAAEFLLEVMQKETGKPALGARCMLCQFDVSALPFIAQKLSDPQVAWRDGLLEVLWAIISVEKPRDRVAAIQSVFPSIDPLLEDHSVIPFEHELPIEVEYEYRICDEAYALCQRLLNPDFDESLFTILEFEERDIEIRNFRSRINALVS